MRHTNIFLCVFLYILHISLLCYDNKCCLAKAYVRLAFFICAYFICHHTCSSLCILNFPLLRWPWRSLLPSVPSPWEKHSRILCTHLQLLLCLPKLRWVSGILELLVHCQPLRPWKSPQLTILQATSQEWANILTCVSLWHFSIV